MNVRGWIGDLVLGVRLAVGGSRTSLTRLALSSLGITIAVAVLLVAAAVGTINSNRDARANADVVLETEPKAGTTPTYYFPTTTYFRNERVEISYVSGTGPTSPKPTGLPALPKPGEMYVSPALAEVLQSDDGEYLRPRLPDRIAGTLDKSLVVMPGDLVAWVGADDSLRESANPVYHFGYNPGSPDLDLDLLALLVVGGVVLLLPVLVFISSASRIAGAERDRRLSAMRLVGAGSRQVRRIAAAESLVSAAVGLVLGTAVFLVARLFAEDVTLFGNQVYRSDVVPNPALLVLIVVLIPMLAVMTAVFALRRTIIEPLGVVRQSKPIRRRMWWRFALVALGVLLMVTQFGLQEESVEWVVAVSAGAVLLLVGVPVLLPWLVERVAGQLSGGPSSWLLAIRRLQLDSGTPARIVGGVAVVLAGSIALQTMLLSVENGTSLAGLTLDDEWGVVDVSTDVSLASDVVKDLSAAEGVLNTHQIQYGAGYEEGEEKSGFSLVVLDCAALRDLGGLQDCQDGDIFQSQNETGSGRLPPPGTPLEFRKFLNQANENWDPSAYEVVGKWTVPPNITKVSLNNDLILSDGLYVTPGALQGQPVGNESARAVAMVDKQVTANQLEGIFNAVAEHRWRIFVYTYNTAPTLSANESTLVAIRNALYAGSFFTLLLAGVSVLVLALEHIRERRRPLAALAASGVPTGVLGRSLLWQVALPIALGVVMAILTGIGLAALMLRLTKEPLTIDWQGVTLLSAAAVTLTLLVSALTLPFLRSATRLTTLRTE